MGKRDSVKPNENMVDTGQMRYYIVMRTGGLERNQEVGAK